MDLLSHAKRQLDSTLAIIHGLNHLLPVAVLAAVAVAHPSRLARIVLALSAVLLATDAVLLLVAVGPFIGEALLAVTIATYAAGALRLKPER